MRALLLSAGLGTRLRPITNGIPKCLVPINGVPLLGYWFDLLIPAGVKPLLVNLHYFPDQVLDFINSCPRKADIETVHEPELLGTAGTALANRAFFQEQSFMLIHADNLSRFPVADFLQAHATRPSHCAMTMMVFTAPNPSECGIVELNSDNVVVNFHEKVASPPGNLANGAVYILEPEVMHLIASLGGPFIDFSTQVIPRLMGRIYTYVNSDYHRDIGTPESYAQAQKDFVPTT
ncbi:MAG: nucleotidyltransferase family protein, partial [Spirochaetia bacterium]|nr:nucleotidyltransferase family protein [Spirochaetia bacterium]